MKFVITSIFVFSLSWTFSQSIDSVEVDGKWYKYYPYDQLASLAKKYPNRRNRRRYRTSYWGSEQNFDKEKGYDFVLNGKDRDVIIPFEYLPDGDYIQIVKFSDNRRSRRYRSRRRRKRQYKKEAKIKHYQGVSIKELNTVADTLIPFAIFSVRDSKLNGKVFFLDPHGDTITTGQYVDNMREGLWDFSRKNELTKNYKGGVLHGKSHFVKKFKKSQNVEDKIYKEGVLTEFVDSKVRQNYVSTTTKYYSYDGHDKIIEEFSDINDRRIEEGKKINGDKVGDWITYNGRGKVASKESYFDEPIKLSKEFRAWANGLPEGQLWDDIPGFNVFSKTTSRIDNPFRSYRRSFIGKWDYIYAYGTGVYNHGNNNKWFSFDVDEDGTFKPDTLFHENGQPYYIFKSDSVFQEYVLEYYDTKGGLYKIDQKPWYEPSSYDKGKVYKYGGEILSKKYISRYGRPYEWSRMMKPADFDSTEKKLVKTVLRHSGSQMLTETYYLPQEHIKMHYDRYELNKKGIPLYKVEVRQVFNDDYTEAKTRVKVLHDEHLEVVQTFDLDYNMSLYKWQFHEENRSNSKNISGMKIYKFNNYRYYDNDYPNFESMFFSNGYTKYMNHNLNKELGHIENIETSYIYDSKPVNGSVEIQFKGTYKNKHDSKFEKKGKNKYKISLVWDENTYRSKVRDEFGLEQKVGVFDAFPDYQSNLRFEKSKNIDGIEKVVGEFKNGKKHGNWKSYSPSGRLVIDQYFNEGKPIDTAYIYIYQKKEKRKLFNEITGTYESASIPELTWVQYKYAYDSNGDISSMIRFDKDGNVEVKYSYKDGKCDEYVSNYTNIYDWDAMYALAPSNMDRYVKDNYERWKKDYDRYKHELMNSSTIYSYDNGQLSQIKYHKKINENEYRDEVLNFKNGVFHGPHVYDRDTGNFEMGIYSGTIYIDKANDKHVIQHINNGLLMKEELFSQDAMLSELTFDTNMVKQPGFITQIFSKDWRIPAIEQRKDLVWRDKNRDGFYKSYYADGTLRAEGQMERSSSRKVGTWKYYRTDGSLKNTVDYGIRLFATAQNDSLKSFGLLTEYENGKAIYQAEIIQIFERFNCDKADNYETRQLYIKHDIKEDTVKLPSRPMRITFETDVLQAEGDLENGLPSGLWKFYDRYGGLHETGLYENGYRQGRWIEGDLTGVAFIGDFCINPNAFIFNENVEEEMKKNLSFDVVVYNRGKVISRTSVQAYMNKRE